MPPQHEIEMFEMALRAFGMFTTDEKRSALSEFSTLRYKQIEDRLIEAVHRVIAGVKP